MELRCPWHAAANSLRQQVPGFLMAQFFAAFKSKKCDRKKTYFFLFYAPKFLRAFFFCFFCRICARLFSRSIFTQLWLRSAAPETRTVTLGHSDSPAMVRFLKSRPARTKAQLPLLEKSILSFFLDQDLECTLLQRSSDSKFRPYLGMPDPEIVALWRAESLRFPREIEKNLI